MATKQKKQKSKQKLVVQEPVALPETRQDLMLMAKDRGIKNFRILNKAELGQVLADGVSPEQIEQVVIGAVTRWKAGWGSKKVQA